MHSKKEQIQIISNDSLFSTSSSFKIVMRNCMFWIFVEIVKMHSSETIWAYSASEAIYSTRLKLTGQLDIQIFPANWCFRQLQVNWTGVIVTDDMKHVITLPSIGQVSVWTHKGLKHINPMGPHQIQSLSDVLYDIIDLEQSTEGGTG